MQVLRWELRTSSSPRYSNISVLQGAHHQAYSRLPTSLAFEPSGTLESAPRIRAPSGTKPLKMGRLVSDTMKQLSRTFSNLRVQLESLEPKYKLPRTFSNLLQLALSFSNFIEFHRTASATSTTNLLLTFSNILKLSRTFSNFLQLSQTSSNFLKLAVLPVLPTFY